MPTLGRPTSANLGSCVLVRLGPSPGRRAGGRRGGRGAPRRRARASRRRRSGSPNPSARKAGTSCSSSAASTLFATTSTGDVARRRRRASCASSSVIPDATSTTRRTRCGLLDRPHRLPAGERFHSPGPVQVSGRVDESEAPAVPCRLELHPVARDARVVVGDRLPPAEEPVDQGRLADVLPPDDRDPGRAHRPRASGRRRSRDRGERGAERRVDVEVAGVDHDRVAREGRKGSPSRLAGPARGARRPRRSPRAPRRAGRRARRAPRRGRASRRHPGTPPCRCLDPPSRRRPRPRERCAARIAERTAGCAATALTFDSTSLVSRSAEGRASSIEAPRSVQGST